MSEEIEKLLNSYLRSNDEYLDRVIPKYLIDNIVPKIIDLYREQEIRTNDTIIENEKLKAQVQMKDNLINMYENIISKSNFCIILDKKKKVGDKE